MTLGRIVVVWLHVAAAAAWVGGLLYASHVVVPAVRRGERGAAALLPRGRLVAWGAIGLLVLTGLENLRHARAGSFWLMAKVLGALLVIPMAAHRDFALVPRAAAAIQQGEAPVRALAGLVRLDRVLALLGVLLMLLWVGIARGR